MITHSEFLSHMRTTLDFLVDQSEEEELSDSDLIFVFGNKNQRIPKHAALLFKKGIAPLVLVTGKYGKAPIVGVYKTEAELFASVMIEEGVPASSIILECEARNTLQNVLFGMEVLRAQDIFPKKLALCAAPSLLRRARATFARQFPDIRVVASTYASSAEDIIDSYTAERVLGEIDRLMSYAKMGDIAQVDIPVRVHESYMAASHAVFSD